MRKYEFGINEKVLYIARMEKTGKNKGGRPKSKLDLPKGWQDEVLELYSVGGADIEVKAMIYRWRKTFSHELFQRWIDEEPEFFETIKMGRMMSEAWWNENGRTNLKDKSFNYVGWYMQMKNRFGWADKQDINNNNTNVELKKEDLTDDEIKRIKDNLNGAY